MLTYQRVIGFLFSICRINILISRSIFISPECYKYGFYPGHKKTNSTNNIVDCQNNRDVLIQKGTEAGKLCGRPVMWTDWLPSGLLYKEHRMALALAWEVALAILLTLWILMSMVSTTYIEQSDQVSVKMRSISRFRIKILDI